ncbi:hypothetical protein ACQPU1_03690 [Clostridium paraputrificum]|uniref:hypothetical protein n=1 Tax=Clostridium TaxID=1485 RepID=UPI003D33A09E
MDATPENIEAFIKNWNLNMATLEQLGSLIIAIGYIYFIFGADLDIKETLDINTNGASPTTVTLNGAEIILLGYIILWVVAKERLKEKEFENAFTSNNTSLSPFIQLADSYLLSVFVNLLRVDALAKIDLINKSGEAFV